jgi:hypothetical protein
MKDVKCKTFKALYTGKNWINEERKENIDESISNFLKDKEFINSSSAVGGKDKIILTIAIFYK